MFSYLDLLIHNVRHGTTNKLFRKNVEYLRLGGEIHILLAVYNIKKEASLMT